MKSIYTARDPWEANLLKSLLAEAGIEAVVQGEALSQVWGEVPFQAAVPTVWVRDEDVERAGQVVARFNSGPDTPSDSPPWNCPNCGESIEPQFTECWKCGTSRPESDAQPESH